MKYSKFAVLLAGAAVVSGCNSRLSTPISPKAIVISNEINSNINQEKALIANLMDAYDCSTNNLCTKFTIYTDDDESEKKKIELFVDAGIALSNHYCENYFRAVNQATRHRQFVRSTTNDVGGAVSAVLGLVEAGSAVTGGIGAGFSFLDSGFRNYEDSYVVDPNLAGLQALVKSAQHDMVVRIDANPSKNIFRAVTRIEEYANLCSFLGMQNLVDASVADKTKAIKMETNPVKSSKNPGDDGPKSEDIGISWPQGTISEDNEIQLVIGDTKPNNIQEAAKNSASIERVGEQSPPPPP